MTQSLSSQASPLADDSPRPLRRNARSRYSRKAYEDCQIGLEGLVDEICAWLEACVTERCRLPLGSVRDELLDATGNRTKQSALSSKEETAVNDNDIELYEHVLHHANSFDIRYDSWSAFYQHVAEKSPPDENVSVILKSYSGPGRR